ncbi:hypothetical protein B0T24DRAFT_555190 [Lasiosphaeria ovina]|uniref:ER-bound oxygenase mpaB/mpaB'/Rubber oxygenase catalytic domain-containing protein n=1 Tax=Lasiosphaeria ovina TaxID=92902 RepID=A0AAE0N6E7_9PEZI|nr:hypothetical protein B0T24DRAFT_555190 [Lasiosphaeria ovina]
MQLRLNLPALASIQGSGWIYGVAGFVSYLVVIRLLRYRFRNKLLRKHAYPTRRAMAAMTVEEAHAIHGDLSFSEFPLVFYNATSFALFKTYAIPTISKLLMATGQLSRPENVSARAADTGVLVAEFTYNAPGSDRSVDAMARVNFLHSRYRKAGAILDDDMLYTLALFALESGRWTDRYEWRKLTPVERCAAGVVYRSLGYALETPFDALKPYMLQPGTTDYTAAEVEADTNVGSTIDGLTWLEALDKWSVMYEREKMVPSATSRDVAQCTIGTFLIPVPRFLRPFATNMISALVDPLTRRAMMLPDPRAYHGWLLTTTFALRRWTIRYLLPPRPGWLRISYFSPAADPQTGRFHATYYHVAHPWYIAPSFWARWGPSALLAHVTGGYVPGAAEFHPEGYKIADVGPKYQQGKGAAEMEANREKQRQNYAGTGPAGRCPMTL